MPILNPGTNDHKPRDWRQAYDAFIAFQRAVKTVAGRLRQPIETDGWYITTPGRFKGMADPRWQLTFMNLAGRWETVYIGSSGMVARKTIRELHEQYLQVLLARGVRNPRSRRPTQSKIDYRYDHTHVQRMRDRWSEMIKAGSRSIAAWNEQLAKNPDVVSFMKLRAGILNMSMKDYLFRHPMSTKWPAPPRSEQELRGRIQQGEDYERSVGRDHINEELNSPVDDGPGWMG